MAPRKRKTGLSTTPTTEPVTKRQRREITGEVNNDSAPALRRSNRSHQLPSEPASTKISSAKRKDIRTANPVPTSAASAPSLFTIPQELQDVIFELAYHRDPSMHFVHGNEWVRRERDERKRTLGYVSKPFPSPFISQWLISKRFFVAAASAWFESETWDFTRQTSLFSSEWSSIGLFKEFVVSVKDDYRSYGSYTPECPKLTHLDLLIDNQWEWNTNDVGKFAWQERYTDTDFAAFLRTSGLLSLRGLTKLTINIGPGHMPYANSTEAKTMLKANTRALEAFVRGFALQPKQDLTSDQLYHVRQPTALYNGSKVMWSAPAAGVTLGAAFLPTLPKIIEPVQSEAEQSVMRVQHITNAVRVGGWAVRSEAWEAIEREAVALESMIASGKASLK